LITLVARFYVVLITHGCIQMVLVYISIGNCYQSLPTYGD